jgi:RNA polymerase sporulation-specific sigma factor
MAEDNINLIYFVLKQLNIYNRNGIDEYFDVGMLGLVKGLKTYTESKGAISTYLVNCIKNEISTEMRNQKAVKRNNGVKPISINTPTTDNLTIEDTIKSDFDMLEYEIKNERIKELGVAITTLKPVEKHVIIDIYFNNKTQLEIAKELGFRQSYVSRIKTRAIKKLRTWFEKREEI